MSIYYLCKYLLLPEMSPPALQYHGVRNWPGLTNGALTRFPPTQTQSCLTTLEGLEVQCRGVKQLKYSAPVFLSYGFSPHSVHKAFNKVLSESRMNTRPICLYHPI